MIASEFNPDRFLGYTVVRLAALMEARIEEVMQRELGLSVRQFGVLAHLARDPGMGSGELARLVLIRPQSMGPLVDGLAKRGFVKREAATHGHKRRTHLTEAGLAVLRQGYAVAESLAIEEAAGLSAVQAARLNDDLMAILRRLER